MNVLMTGSNGGIGRALVRKYASEGYNIIANVHHRSRDFDNYIADLQRAYLVETECAEFDVCDENEVKNLVKDVIWNKKHIDVLINNAGWHMGDYFR